MGEWLHTPRLRVTRLMPCTPEQDKLAPLDYPDYNGYSLVNPHNNNSHTYGASVITMDI